MLQVEGTVPRTAVEPFSFGPFRLDVCVEFRVLVAVFQLDVTLAVAVSIPIYGDSCAPSKINAFFLTLSHTHLTTEI